MLTEQEIRAIVARRKWITMSVVYGAAGAAFLYIIVVGYFFQSYLISLAVSRFGEAARDVMQIAMILMAFPIFLIPICLSSKHIETFRIECPACRKDLIQKIDRVLATRCCPACDERIVDGGKVHPATVYDRYQELRSRRFLKFWLWGFPTFGGLIIAWQLVDRSAFQDCSPCLWFCPLYGTVAAGWAWLRTFDRRYVPQLLASAVLLGIGAVLFWQAP